MDWIAVTIILLVLGVARLLFLTTKYKCPKRCALCYYGAWATAILVGIIWIVAGIAAM